MLIVLEVLYSHPSNTLWLQSALLCHSVALAMWELPQIVKVGNYHIVLLMSFQAKIILLCCCEYLIGLLDGSCLHEKC